MAEGGQTPPFLLHYTWQKGYHANIGHLPAPTQISPVWAAVVMSCIIQGNATHDTLTGGWSNYFCCR